MLTLASENSLLLILLIWILWIFMIPYHHALAFIKSLLKVIFCRKISLNKELYLNLMVINNSFAHDVLLQCPGKNFLMINFNRKCSDDKFTQFSPQSFLFNARRFHKSVNTLK